MNVDEVFNPNSGEETSSDPSKEVQPDTTAENEVGVAELENPLSSHANTEQPNVVIKAEEHQVSNAAVMETLLSLKLEVENLQKQFTVQQLMLKKCLDRLDSQRLNYSSYNIQDIPASDNDEYLYGFNSVD